MTRDGVRRKASGIALFTGALVLAAALGGPAQAVDTGTPPGFTGVIGGSGAADMYPSGLEISNNPGDDTVVVADTGNNRVSKYTQDGTLIWHVGSYGAGTNQFNNPRDVGIDSAGNVYVADTANLRIVKLTSAGSWVTSWKGPSNDLIKSPIGISVHEDLVYVADGAVPAVRVYSTSGAQLNRFGSTGNCIFAAVRDVDADADGNIYVANYTRNTILKLGPDGSCLGLWGSKGSGTGQFLNPYGVRLATDPVSGQEYVYVADSNNDRVQVFTRTGGFVAAMGSTGDHATPGTFTEMRRVAVANNGDVWGADLWGWRVVKFTRTATGWEPGSQIGSTTPQLTDAAAFHEPRQISFDATGNLWVTDTVHHRVVTFSPEGQVLGACGLRGSSDGEFNWPRGSAIDSATGDLWIADTKQYRLQAIAPGCGAGQILGRKGVATAQFNWPMAIAIRQSDRTLWVADTNNNRVTVWDLDTRTALRTYGGLGSGVGQFSQPRGISVGPDGSILVADRTNNRVVELSASVKGVDITWVRSINHGFKKPEGVAKDSAGRLFVADTLNDRLVAVAADGSLLGATTGPSGLADPAAVAVGPDDTVYVSDTYNDRVVTFSYDAPPPDVTAPVAAISSPAANAVLSSPITVAGSATDDASGVATVQVTLQDRTTKRWWNAATSSWGSGAVQNPATVTGAGTPSATWSWTTTLARDTGGTGLLTATARATDSSGNIQTIKPQVRFSLAP